MPTYRLEEGSMHDKFLSSTAKIQVVAGGFGNGKTSVACIKALRLARDYPGSNGLIARSTYPKLNDTIRKEFFKWCPPEAIKSFSKHDNVCVLDNNTTINFRYIAQKGDSDESTSNLLSATYDWIIVDQLEDPEISYKDFTDLLGRLRGQTPYNPPNGEYNHQAPKNGTRYFIGLCNPTRNWVYRKLVKPVQTFKKTGKRMPDLIVNKDTGIPMIELFEGSTYDNSDNLPPDFIATMEATYSDTMRKRFILGEWGAYEGLVYADYDENVHMVSQEKIQSLFKTLQFSGALQAGNILEGFDYGIVSPSCYLLGFVDQKNNIFIMDGFYAAGKSPKQLAQMRDEILIKYSIDKTDLRQVFADPSIFRRTGGQTSTKLSVPVANLLRDEGFDAQRADNDLTSGITKMQSYIKPVAFHKHPFNDEYNAPFLYIANTLEFIDTEICDYYWKKDTIGEYDDKPRDGKDHSLDTLRYLLTVRPIAARIPQRKSHIDLVSTWREHEEKKDYRSPHHAGY